MRAADAWQTLDAVLAAETASGAAADSSMHR